MRRWFVLLLLTLLLPFASAAVAACVHEAQVEVRIDHASQGWHGQAQAAGDSTGAQLADTGDCHAGCGACVLHASAAMQAPPAMERPHTAPPHRSSHAGSPPERPQWAATAGAAHSLLR